MSVVKQKCSAGLFGVQRIQIKCLANTISTNTVDRHQSCEGPRIWTLTKFWWWGPSMASTLTKLDTEK